MKPYEKIYYTLFRSAFTQQKLAHSYEDQKAYYAVWHFLILWHGVYGTLLVGELWQLMVGVPIPGWLLLTGALAGIFSTLFVVPSKIRLKQLCKLDYRQSKTEMRRFGEMLLINGLFIVSLLIGFGLLMWVMSLGY